MISRIQQWFLRQRPAVQAGIAVAAIIAGAMMMAPAWFGGASPGNPNDRPVLPPVRTPLSGGTAISTVAALPTASLPQYQEPELIDTGITWTTTLRTVGSVIVVLVLIVVSARALKYFVARVTPETVSGPGIRVLETTHIVAPSGRGRLAMHLVEVSGRVLLVGASDTQLTLLAELDDGTETVRAASVAGVTSPLPLEGPGALNGTIGTVEAIGRVGPNGNSGTTAAAFAHVLREANAPIPAPAVASAPVSSPLLAPAEPRMAFSRDASPSDGDVVYETREAAMPGVVPGAMSGVLARSFAPGSAGTLSASEAVAGDEGLAELLRRLRESANRMDSR